MSYFVHWNGWNKKWDEWIDDELRLSKASKDDNICGQLLCQKNNNVKENIININDSNDSEYRLDKVQLLPLLIEIQNSLYQQYKLIESKYFY